MNRARPSLRASSLALAATALLGLALASPPVASAARRAAKSGPAVAPEPKPKRISYIYDGFKQCVRPLSRSVDPAVGIRRLTGNPREAANVDERDEVRLPSTWWTPRVGFRSVAPEQMLAATGSSDAPAEGTWTIVDSKGVR